tara:strand:- start:2584 stop:3411 length:828 start_codon:yes stop_codon:yes gene_type:complete
MNENLQFLKKNGYLVLNNFIETTKLEKIKQGFEKHNQFLIDQKLTDDLTEKRRVATEKIINYCPEIIDIISDQKIVEILKKYLGNDFKILNAYPTISKPLEADANDERNFTSQLNICCWHHDQIGKQLKLIIVLDDIDEDQNCLEYAVGSHTVRVIDKIILKFFNLFGFFKGWNKNVIEHIFRKLIGKHSAFRKETTINKKYNIRQIYAKSGTIYFFDTNGYHRQKPANEKTDFSRKRKTIFLDCVPDISSKRAKLKMHFKSLNIDNYKKIEKFI